MTGSLNRTFHRETVLGSGIGDERIARQRSGGGFYAGIRVEVRSLNRGKGASFAWLLAFSPRFRPLKHRHFGRSWTRKRRSAEFWTRKYSR